MFSRFSPEALERSERTIQAAAIFEGQALLIARACAEAHPVQTVVAEVSPDLEFRGIDRVLTRDLHKRLGNADDGRWVMLFTASDGVPEILARCQEMVRLARLKKERILQLMEKRSKAG